MSKKEQNPRESGRRSQRGKGKRIEKTRKSDGVLVEEKIELKEIDCDGYAPLIPAMFSQS